MKLCFKTLCFLILCLSFFSAPAGAVPGVESPAYEDQATNDDSKKTVEELLAEALALSRQGRSIDSRAKLEQALSLAPNDYRPHLQLAQYYLFEVAHFKLAFRYVKTAEKLFTEAHGSDLTDNLDLARSNEHAMILYLLAEAELNLDRYQDSLSTLDRFASLYRGDWYPGQRAWVLMKLKRIDEAIKVAQAGIVASADPRRTWNILGILLSVSGNRELSLNAFGQAIRDEILMRGMGQVATPLNNAGEVYRELFQDAYAEGAWVKATKLPDGCEHILPSLNLSTLYIDQLRLFAAERALSDFEACFRENSERKDSEHRTILALARGKLAMLSNRIDAALPLIRVALEDQQWFGKIGTNENDVKFAALVTMAQAYRAKSAALLDTETESLSESAVLRYQAVLNTLKAWWLNREARTVALEELDDLEDLSIRHTDTMLTYPTLGSFLSSFEQGALEKRIGRILSSDNRPDAKLHYDLYLAQNYYAAGDSERAEVILERLRQEFRPIDRLAKAEALATLILSKEASLPWFGAARKQKEAEIFSLSEELYRLLPSHIRHYNLRIPVEVRLASSSDEGKQILADIQQRLLQSRFAEAGANSTNFSLVITERPDGEASQVSIHLVERGSNRQRAAVEGKVSDGSEGISSLVNAFIAKAFAPEEDPEGSAIPQLPILRGLEGML